MNQTRTAETAGSKWKLNFCPHCLNVIKDMSDLAHELVFVSGMSIEDISDPDGDIGFDFEFDRRYIDRNDTRASRFYGRTNTEARVVLQEKNKRKNLEENGLEIFRELVEDSDVLEERAGARRGRAAFLPGH